jgi:hypothetical protein
MLWYPETPIQAHCRDLSVKATQVIMNTSVVSDIVLNEWIADGNVLSISGESG